MKLFTRQTKQETIIYTIVWVILFCAPAVDILFNGNTQDFWWIKHSLMDAWATMLSFFIVFLIHNHVLAPMLVRQRKIRLYFIGCVVIVALFQLGHCVHKPGMLPGSPKRSALVPPPPEQGSAGPQRPDDMPPGQNFADEQRPDDMPPPPPSERRRPPIDKHDVSVFIIVIMMLGANLGVKNYFQNEEEQKRQARLRAQSLKQELDYLRYQINPHFIMNTLNNIHALVDIDPEQAKDSIVDMSRMMRYLLYDSEKQYVTLHSAVEFLKKYLNLMKLRYSDNVKLNLSVPQDTHDDIVVAPLVFIPFVENAFKHGVVHNKPSVIDIGIEKKDSRLVFHSHNAKSGAKYEFGGVGLSNVTKRLELIYGNDYSLDIKDEEGDYDVVLSLPALVAPIVNPAAPRRQPHSNKSKRNIKDNA